MKIEIENVLGIENFQLEVAPGEMVEVIGPNASGKTSLAVCLQAVLSHNTNPLGLPATEIKRVYLRHGATQGRVALITSDGTPSEWLPHRGTFVTNADPHSTPEAVGIVDFTDRQNQATKLQPTLLPPPEIVLGRLKADLAELLDPTEIDGVVREIEESGWLAAGKLYNERVRRAKGEWKSITGESWGVRKAKDWRPKEWLAEFENVTEQDAERDLQVARDQLSSLQGQVAISDEEHAMALRAAEDLPRLEQQLSEVCLGRDAKTADLAETRAALAAATTAANRQSLSVREIQRPELLTCPHCEQGVVLVGGALKKEPDATDEAALNEAKAELRKAREVEEYLRTQSQPLSKEVETCEREVAKLQHRFDECQALARKAETKVQTEAGAQELSQFERAHEEALRRRDLIRQERAATLKHKSIADYQAIEHAIGPEGARAQMIKVNLEKFKNVLDRMVGIAKWPKITLRDGSLFGGEKEIPLALCSESERWRAQTMMQISCACMSSSQLIVLDRGDILDTENRKGLSEIIRRLAKKTGMSIVLCSTAGREVGTSWQQIFIGMPEAEIEAEDENV